MRYKILNKLLVVAIIILPAVVDFSCKKQPKCGCDQDVIVTLAKEPGYIIYNREYMSARFVPLANTSAIYYFCTAGEYMDTLEGFVSGQTVLLVSGAASWDCSYLQNAQNYQYQQPMYRAYQITVSAVEEDLYGKKK
jgi:hypothetical protein